MVHFCYRRAVGPVREYRETPNEKSDSEDSASASCEKSESIAEEVLTETEDDEEEAEANAVVDDEGTTSNEDEENASSRDIH